MPGNNTGNFRECLRQFHVGRGLQRRFHRPEYAMLRIPYHAFFAQDDWKVTPRLTVNIGLRYEINMGTYEKHDRLSQFDPYTAESGRKRVSRAPCVFSGPARDARGTGTCSTTPAGGDPGSALPTRSPIRR